MLRTLSINTPFFKELFETLKTLKPESFLPASVISEGKVIKSTGNSVIACIPRVRIKDLCRIKLLEAEVLGEVAGFDREHAVLSLFDHDFQIVSGSKVITENHPVSQKADLISGKVFDGLGNSQEPTNPETEKYKSGFKGFKIPDNYSGKNSEIVSREPISEQFITGVPILDNYIKVGKGQRMGIFAAAGLGKSYLVKQLIEQAVYDIAVIALVGERGREVEDFARYVKTGRLQEKVILIAESSEKSPLRRIYAMRTATTCAVNQRLKDKNVLLIIDSLTRAARAIRDFSIQRGELPINRGLTPAVYSELPLIIEQAGNYNSGSITAFYTVLTEADDRDDPLAAEIKSLLDGHLILSEEAKSDGIIPAIDPVRSLSRLQPAISSPEEQRRIAIIQRMLSRLRHEKDFLLLGGTPDKELKIFADFKNKLIDSLGSDSRRLGLTVDEILLNLNNP